jgi:putative transposase
MPRKRRGWEAVACYHITHRCHNRQFLFRYQKYRQFYVRRLFEGVQRYGIDVLDYVCTSNHVHVLVAAKEGPEISAAMRYAHGRCGQWYNEQRHQSGAFWAGRYHATRIQSGKHLSGCLLYIDMNMVRAGAVRHPSEWEYSAWSELTGRRQRYRIVNVDRLVKCLRMENAAAFREWHRVAVDEPVRQEDWKRETFWSKAIAVDDREWLADLASARGIRV